jgi:hypothetical protein
MVSSCSLFPFSDSRFSLTRFEDLCKIFEGLKSSHPKRSRVLVVRIGEGKAESPLAKPSKKSRNIGCITSWTTQLPVQNQHVRQRMVGMSGRTAGRKKKLIQPSVIDVRR